MPAIVSCVSRDSEVIFISNTSWNIFKMFQIKKMFLTPDQIFLLVCLKKTFKEQKTWKKSILLFYAHCIIIWYFDNLELNKIGIYKMHTLHQDNPCVEQCLLFITNYSLKLLIILQVNASLEVNNSELSLNESLRWRNIHIYDRLDR